MMKGEIRKEIIKRRKSLLPDEVLTKSNLAQKIFLQSNIYSCAKSVMVYLPIQNEVQTSEIIKDSLINGKNVLVPVTDMETFEITPCKITDTTEFIKGAFSVAEPKEKISFDKDLIDVILVPGVAFSKLGGRVGFGKGCYDKFLRNIPAKKVGFCYDFQLWDSINTDEFDVSMDFVVTEKEILKCSRASL